jgi:hypothetical protein
MHTSKYHLEGYDGPVLVHHNGDWSGDVHIVFKEKVFGTWDNQKKEEQEAIIPGALLVALALPVTQDQVSRALENFAERLPETLGLMKVIEKDEASRKPKRKGKK